MLIQKPPVTGDIVAFRLTNGEEIVGKLLSQTSTDYQIARPVIIGVHSVGQNQAQIGFMPFMTAVPDDGTVQFNRDHVTVRPTHAREDVAKGYIRATSAIEIPTAGQTAKLIQP